MNKHNGAYGRLRGAWTGFDGAAGRMTALSGLHNMPAVLRRAVLPAEDGHVFVRADLGQIEPRVLAAVSGDGALAAVTAADDMYLPVAAEFGVDRPTAKVAMIAWMYGQTTGHGGGGPRRMRAAYPVAMGYLDGADLVRPGGPGPANRRWPAAADVRWRVNEPRQGSRSGRYGRNAVVQGAAAELFKMWAVTVRARSAPLGGRIVLCLHDELLLHVSCRAGAGRWPGWSAAASREASRRRAPGGRVRFIADISVAGSWAEAKHVS